MRTQPDWYYESIEGVRWGASRQMGEKFAPGEVAEMGRREYAARGHAAEVVTDDCGDVLVVDGQHGSVTATVAYGTGGGEVIYDCWARPFTP